MNGARFVRDQLELAGFKVAIADAQKVKGLAPLACTTDRIDAWVLPRAVPPRPGPRDLAAHPGVGAERERARFRLLWSATGPRARTASTPPCWPFGKPCPVSDLFGAGGRQLLARLTCPSRGSATSPPPWPSSTTWTTSSTAAKVGCGTSAPTTPLCRC
jgi:transposase